MSSVAENYMLSDVNSDSGHVLYKYIDCMITNYQRIIHNFAQCLPIFSSDVKVVKQTLRWFQGIPGLHANLLKPVKVICFKFHIQKY